MMCINFKDMEVLCREQLSGETVCMSLDGWSNVHNEPIVCVAATSSTGVTYVTDTIDTSGKPHTSDYLKELAVNTISATESKYGCKVKSFVSDNAANMTAMRQNLTHDEQNSDIITYGCGAHMLNLLAKDLEIHSVQKYIVKIVKYFRNVHLPAAWYKEAGGKKLPLPLEVRWNSVADTLSGYLANWHILLAVCEQHRDSIDKDIAASIVNLSLKRNCEDYLSRLLPISSALDKMQAAQCSIGTSVEIWKDLAEQLSKCLSKEEVSKFEKRMNANLTPHHFLANLLTPQYQGKRLTQAQLDSALDLCSQYPSTLPTVMEYQARTERFKEFRFSSDVLGSVAPLTWWRAANPPVTVMNLVTSLLTAINSSASIERVFSTVVLVHSKVRNKLGVDKAGKLVFIYRMLNIVPANAIEYY